jgi:hypothetical protein
MHCLFLGVFPERYRNFDLSPAAIGGNGAFNQTPLQNLFRLRDSTPFSPFGTGFISARKLLIVPEPDSQSIFFTDKISRCCIFTKFPAAPLHRYAGIRNFAP